MKLDSTTRYEIQAEAFRIMTGHLAPGKDASMHSYPAPYEERQAAWKAWALDNMDCISALLLAFERIMPDQDDES